MGALVDPLRSIHRERRGRISTLRAPSIGQVLVQGLGGEHALGPAQQGLGIGRLDPLRDGSGQSARAQMELGGQNPRCPALHTLLQALLHPFLSAFLQKMLRKTAHGRDLVRVPLGVKLPFMVIQVGIDVDEVKVFEPPLGGQMTIGTTRSVP